MNRTFLIGVFLLLIASAFFCDILGIHSFFGAFIAGIICPKSGQFNNELFPKLELITVELLLPLFFASSGMRTNLGSLNDCFYGGITVLIIVVASLGKFLPALFATKVVTRRSWKFSAAVGILMNTRGMVELIALNIGLQLGILSPRLFTMLIIMALVTTFITCPLMWFVYIRTYVREQSSDLDLPELDLEEQRQNVVNGNVEEKHVNGVPNNILSPVLTKF